MSLLNPVHGSASYCITSRIGPLIIEINTVLLSTAHRPPPLLLSAIHISSLYTPPPPPPPPPPSPPPHPTSSTTPFHSFIQPPHRPPNRPIHPCNPTTLHTSSPTSHLFLPILLCFNFNRNTNLPPPNHHKHSYLLPQLHTRTLYTPLVEIGKFTSHSLTPTSIHLHSTCHFGEGTTLINPPI